MNKIGQLRQHVVVFLMNKKGTCERGMGERPQEVRMNHFFFWLLLMIHKQSVVTRTDSDINRDDQCTLLLDIWPRDQATGQEIDRRMDTESFQ